MREAPCHRPTCQRKLQRLSNSDSKANGPGFIQRSLESRVECRTASWPWLFFFDYRTGGNAVVLSWRQHSSALLYGHSHISATLGRDARRLVRRLLRKHRKNDGPGSIASLLGVNVRNGSRQKAPVFAGRTDTGQVALPKPD